MKKLLGLMIIMAFMSQAYGQTSFGLHVGATSSALTNTLEGDPGLGYTEETKRPLGFMLGVVGQTMINESLSFVGEINFQQKGVKIKSSFVTEILGTEVEREDSEYEILFNSIEVPLLARMEFGEMTRFYVNAGPYVNFLINGKQKYSSEVTDFISGTTETNTETNKIIFKEEPANYTGDDFYAKDEIHRLEIGAYIGGGASIPMGNGKLVVDARYGIGLTDYNDLNDADKPDGYKAIKANNITLSVGYMIEL